MSRARLRPAPAVSGALALLRANARYWPAVARRARSQLSRWQCQAKAIPEPSLRSIALGKLRDERFNSEVSATLATLAPAGQRGLAIDAIVALQVAYDYLDLLTERRAPTGVAACESMLLALVDAVQPRQALPESSTRKEHGPASLTPIATAEADEVSGADGTAYGEQGDDGGYLAALVATVRDALRQLPAAPAVQETARASAQRCAGAQARLHAAAPEELASEPPEQLAGAAASVLCLHALIAAAANPATSVEDARRLDALYLQIGALSMLDSLLDADEDAASGQPGFLSRYASPQEMGRRLACVAREAIAATEQLPRDAGHHLLTLAGVIAYYASSPAASAPPARDVLDELRRELPNLLAPALWTMQAWRIAKRAQLVSSSSIGEQLRRLVSRVGKGSRPIRSSGAAGKAPPEGKP